MGQWMGGLKDDVEASVGPLRHAREAETDVGMTAERTEAGGQGRGEGYCSVVKRRQKPGAHPERLIFKKGDQEKV